MDTGKVCSDTKSAKHYIAESDSDEEYEPASTHDDEKLQGLPLDNQTVTLPEEYEGQFNHFLELVTDPVEDEGGEADEKDDSDSNFSMKRSKRKRKSDSLTCRKCGAVFKYQSTFDYHKKSKCGTRMIIESNKLVKKHLKEVFTCNICKKELGSRTSLMVHMRLHTGERPFKCDTCGRTFTQKIHMRDHMKTHKDGESGQVQMFFCAECNYTCADKHLLRSHLRVHFGDKLYQCSVCSKRFRTYSNLTNHKIIHSDKKDFVCFICGKEFLRKPSLADHMKTHTKEKPFACDICGKEFADKTRRNTHVKRHTGELTHQCEDCGRKFAAAYDLRIHQRKHTGEKPFPCPICGRMFNRKAIMDTHMTIHTGRKDYKCTQCEEAFNRKSKLDIHIAVAHSDEVYCCSICKRVFKCKSYLIPHMKTHMGVGRKRGPNRAPNRKELRANVLAADFCKQILVESVDFNNKQLSALKPLFTQVENVSGKFPANCKERLNGSSTESEEEYLENVIASMNNNDPIDAKISAQALNEEFPLKSPPSADLPGPAEPIVFIKVENDL